MTKDRVLVTGGAGFIGHHLVSRLLAAGRRVTVLDDLSTGHLDQLPRHHALDVVVGSVLDDGAVERAARDAAGLYHLAGIVGVRRATERGGEALRVSDEGTRRVLAATGAAPAVLFSSSAVYGLDGAARARAGPDEAACLEYDGGEAGYACGKLRLERQGARAAAAGRRVLVVRPFNVVGSGQPSAYGMVLPTFLQAARRGEPLVVHDDGRQTRCFSAVGTCVEALLRLEGMETAWGRTLDVGAEAPTSIRALAELVLRVTGSASPIEHVPYASVFPGRRDVRARVPDVGPLHALLGSVRWPTLEDVVAALASA